MNPSVQPHDTSDRKHPRAGGAGRSFGWAGIVALLGLSVATGLERSDAGHDALLARASAADQAGRVQEAILAYEDLLREDATFESIVAPRLATLHASGANPADAMAWAMRAARHFPDPEAYLAGVHAQLGQWQEAEFLLRQAAHGERTPQRRATLLWQLADVQERQGRPNDAIATLEMARDTLDDGTVANDTARRLDALRVRHAGTPPSSGATPPEPQGGDRP